MNNRKAMRPSEIATRVGEYLQEGDLDGIMTMFHPDCTICFSADAPPQQGLDVIHEIFAPFVEMRPTLISQVMGE